MDAGSVWTVEVKKRTRLCMYNFTFPRRPAFVVLEADCPRVAFNPGLDHRLCVAAKVESFRVARSRPPYAGSHDFRVFLVWLVDGS